MFRKDPTHENCLSLDEFYGRVDALLSVAAPNQYALVSLDFDNFKYINDLFDYETGNKTLSAIINHFSNLLGCDEFLCNVNADNFLLFLKFDSVDNLTTRIYYMTNTSDFLVGILPDHYNFVSSGGIYKIHNPTETLLTMVDCANFARKRAKGNHSSTILNYNTEMSDELEWRKQITLNMEQALENGEFEMYVQPKVLIHNSAVVGGEALVRWNSKVHGLIYPDKFIPVFEQNGFVTLLDFYMLEQACIFIKNCMEEGLPVLPISVNFSKLHIDSTPHFVGKIFQVVTKYGVPSNLIEIELTESVLSRDFDALVGIFSNLKELGFKVSLDDFGNAYSSLNLLKDLPLDIIKIDKSFLDSSSDNDKGRLVISKIVDLIKALHLRTVVEGIEHEEQVDFLKMLGCEIGQGYFYARPMPSLDYKNFIVTRPSLSKGDWNLLESGSHQNFYSDMPYNLEEFKQLKINEQRYRIISEQNDDIIFEWDFITDKIWFSDKFEKIMGYNPLKINTNDNKAISELIHPDDIEIFYRWVDNLKTKDRNPNTEFRARTSDGKYLWIRANSSTLSDDNGNKIKTIGVLSNVTYLKSTIDFFKAKSQQDSLTKLYNKESTQVSINNILSTAGVDEHFALFILDIDNFKGVNDNLGHQFGDTVLVDTANKIRALFRETDIVGRIGGDEFIVFMRDISDASIACNKADELTNSIRNSYYGESTRYSISCSVGIAYSPTHGRTFHDLYRLADIALYETKKSGKDGYTVYRDDMTVLDEGTMSRTPMETERFLTSYFDGDPVYTIFEMLYETKDIQTTINKVLEIAGKRFDVDRVYIFEFNDNSTICNNTYEWCAKGVQPEIHHLQNISVDDMSLFFSQYNAEGIFFSNDISSLDKFSYDTLAPQGIKSLLHCAIYDEGVMKGFIGFDDCKKPRQWRGEEVAVLAYIARVLSAFILKKQISAELFNSYQNQIELLNNLPGYVYVIDLKNYNTLYLNKAIIDMGCDIGEKCYEIAYGNDAPCENCPAKRLSKKVNSFTTELFSERIDGWVSAAASKVSWTGVDDAALICCTDISKYKLT